MVLIDPLGGHSIKNSCLAVVTVHIIYVVIPGPQQLFYITILPRNLKKNLMEAGCKLLLPSSL